MYTENIEPIRLDFNEGAHLELTNQAGEIRISSWAENNNIILIQAKKEVSFSYPQSSKSPEFFLNQLGVDVRGDANELVVNSIFPQPIPSGVSLSINYDVKIPKSASLRIFNMAGDIFIHGTAGSKDINLEAGDFFIHGVKGSMDVNVEAGDIKVLHSGYLEPADIINLMAEAGEVILALPANSAFDIDALVEVGEIMVKGHQVIVNSTLIGENIQDSVNGGGTDFIIRLEAGDFILTVP